MELAKNMSVHKTIDCLPWKGLLKFMQASDCLVSSSQNLMQQWVAGSEVGLGWIQILVLPLTCRVTSVSQFSYLIVLFKETKTAFKSVLIS